MAGSARENSDFTHLRKLMFNYVYQNKLNALKTDIKV